jgi:hypothetical protein
VEQHRVSRRRKFTLGSVIGKVQTDGNRLGGRLHRRQILDASQRRAVFGGLTDALRSRHGFSTAAQQFVKRGRLPLCCEIDEFLADTHAERGFAVVAKSNKSHVVRSLFG